MHNLWNSKRGTSLVEILVVMVVLLVGIMTVIQLFPTGFRVVRAGESQTIATRLAQQEIERWKNMPQSLPVGIVPIDEDDSILNSELPGPPYRDFSTNAGGWVIQSGRIMRGNALNTRQILGETTTIPLGTYFRAGSSSQYGSKYTLAFSPIEVSYDDGYLVGLAIKSGDLRRRIGDIDSDPPPLRPGQYAIDYTLTDGKFSVAFPRNPGVNHRVYYISYSFWAEPTGGGEPELFSKASQQILDNTPGGNGDWIEVPVVNVPAGYKLTEMEPRTDTCARGFIETSSPWSKDPYEFKLADSIMGVIAFNPTGHSMYEYTARGIRPIEARIDYRIYDLRVIREDRVIPPAQGGEPSIPVKMSLRFMLNLGDPTDNPKEYTTHPDEPAGEPFGALVYKRDGTIAVPLPVLLIDLATGLRVKMDVPQIAPPGITVGVDYKPGIVHLPKTADLVDYSDNVIAANVPLAGRHIRFFYRADGDWSVQCSKAYESYSRVYGAMTLDYRSYRLIAANADHGPRLLFAPCEAGKSVIVDYSYVLNGVEHKVSGEAHKIDTLGDDWGFELTAPRGATIPTAARMVVVGSSFTVRVIWRDGKSYRHIDMDTNLMRK